MVYKGFRDLRPLKGIYKGSTWVLLGHRISGFGAEGLGTCNYRSGHGPLLRCIGTTTLVVSIPEPSLLCTVVGIVLAGWS